jgi:hypothetical protein
MSDQRGLVLGMMGMRESHNAYCDRRLAWIRWTTAAHRGVEDLRLTLTTFICSTFSFRRMYRVECKPAIPTFHVKKREGSHARRYEE